MDRVCNACGGELKGNLKFCPPCLSQQQQQHRDKNATPYIAPRAKRKNSAIAKASSYVDHARYILGASLLSYSFLFLLCAIASEASDIAQCFCLSAILASLLLALATWAFFWTDLVVKEPLLAIVSLIVPPLAYKAAFEKWGTMRYYLIAHIFASILAAFFALILANLRNVSMHEMLLWSKKVIHFPF